MKYLDLHLKENLVRQTSFLRKEHLQNRLGLKEGALLPHGKVY